jgi:hypothetical protein
MDAVLARDPDVARLVLGEWITLISVDPASGELRRSDPRHGWVPEGVPTVLDLAARPEPVRG